MGGQSAYRTLLVMAAAALVYTLAVVQRMSPPVVALDIMNDLGLNPDHLSLLFATTMVTYGLMQPVAGFWADRFGPRRCLTAAALVLGLGSLVFSLAGGLGLGLPSRALVGLAAGVALMPCLKLAGHWYSPRRFGLACSCILGAGALGNFICGRPLAVTAAESGWRWAFTALGVVGLVLGLAVFWIVRDRPPLPPEDGPTALPPDEPPPQLSFLRTALTVVREPEFWLLGFLYACTDMLYATFTGLWAGPYLMEVQRLGEVTVGNMLSISAVGLLAGPPLWVLLATAWKSYAKVLLTITLLNVLFALVLVWGPDTLGAPTLYLLCLAAPTGAQVAGLIFVLTRGLFPQHLSASAMGLMNVFPIIIGAAMQQVIGAVLTRGGTAAPETLPRDLYGQAFLPLLVCMVVSVPLALWQVRREKKVGSGL